MVTSAAERDDNEGLKFDELNSKIAVRTMGTNDDGSINVRTLGLGIAIGDIQGEIRGFFGISECQEGAANEQVLGDGQTTRYPFPATAAQMTLVSTSTDDTSTGTGARVILVRGNITGNVELFESILLDGTTPVTTVNSYLRVNSIVVVDVGSGKKNAGIITIKNGTDLLAQINVGKNVSRTAIYSIPTGFIGIIMSGSFLSGKDESGVINNHLFESETGNRVDYLALEQETYQNEIIFDANDTPLTVREGTDLEYTGYSKEGTGNSVLSVIINFIIFPTT